MCEPDVHCTTLKVTKGKYSDQTQSAFQISCVLTSRNPNHLQLRQICIAPCLHSLICWRDCMQWIAGSPILSKHVSLVQIWIFTFSPLHQVRQRNELGIYLINLSVADLLYIATLPLWIDYFLHHDNWIHGQESCKLFGFIFYTNIYVSIAFLCCISLDRYLAVAYPLRFVKVRRIKTGLYAT